jgi:5-(carboxyamino)imidazole ribonucleotide mutase
MIIPILLGSESDKEFAKKITKVLDEFEAPYKIHVASAHKVPEMVMDIVKDYNSKNDHVCYITIAGRSNGLSGVVAGSSFHPVIACPPFKDKEDFTININSTLQMPSDTPVMTVIDPVNAALSAIKILAIAEPELLEKVKARIEKIKSTFKK